MTLNKLIEQFNIDYSEAIEFFVSNKWFDLKPVINGKNIELTEEQAKLYEEKLKKYLSIDNAEDIINEFESKFPATSKILFRFFKETNVSKDDQFYIIDFLISNLKQDIMLCTNQDIEELLNKAGKTLLMKHIETLTFFLSYTRTKRKTKYYKNYTVSSRKMEENGAYTFEEYIEILYHLFNEKYIKENDMYKKAARSKNYADTWLFLSMHFICSLRMTDLERIYHPTLPKDPKTVLSEIENGTFSNVDARKVLLSITQRLCVLPLKPNKTKKTQNVPDIKFTVPHSCEVHIGTLFALCEAHQQLKGIQEPIIRKIASYEAISRNMGEDIGKLFIDCNFRCRRANKSFLQAIENLSQDILNEDGPNVKGYMLAALARSHKASYGQFASTAATYLRDEALSGLTPEFVAFELFERGILSFVPSMLLNILTNGEYKQLDIPTQTEFVKKLGFSPSEIENVVSVINCSQQKAIEVVKRIINEDTPILEVLHNIGSGMAFSHQHENLCLLSAIHEVCPYQTEQCTGCEYEISTISTLMHLAGEYKRIVNIYLTIDNTKEKHKYETFAKEIVVPKLEELMIAMKTIYGEETYKEYEELIKDYVK